MSRNREPRLDPTHINELRPTQITVGMREVEAKRQRWRQDGHSKAEQFLGQHLIPVVIGPKQRPYVLDHHHLARALYEEGVQRVLVTIVKDLSKLDKEDFWIFLDHRGWMHPFDDRGRRQAYEAIPKSVGGLVDDPYRSLAGALRYAGGFAKDLTPFSEFLWAEFLRRRIPRDEIESDFGAAREKAMTLARQPDADYLPGWCGPHRHIY